MMKRFLILVVLMIVSGAAWAQPGVWVQSDEVRARLISGVQSIGAETQIDAALELELSDGWHTYWRVSGDSGLPPQFDWSGSENVRDVHVHFPAPERKQEFGLYTFGYSDGVVFPLVITVEEPGKAVVLDLKAQVLVCREICIPQQFAISRRLELGDGAASAMMPLIERAQEKIPVPGDVPGLKIDTVVAGADALAVRVYSKDGFEDVDLFATAPEFALTLPPEIVPEKEDGRYAMIRVPVTSDIGVLSVALKGQELTLTLVAGKSAVEKKIQY